MKSIFINTAGIRHKLACVLIGLIVHLPAFAIEFDVTDATCHGKEDGAIDLIPPTGNGPYSYAWSNGATTEDIFDVGEGTYTVTITDKDGCELTEDVEVGVEEDRPKVSISGGGTRTFCEDDNDRTITLTATATACENCQYRWSTGATSSQIEVSSSGTYSVTATTEDDCSQSDSEKVTIKIKDCDDDDDDDVDIPIITSSDPNDILGPDGVGPEKWVSVNDVMPYTIRFENDPDFATAPAQKVMITDPLDENLNIFSFRLGDFGFGDFVFEVPEESTYYTKRLDVVDSLGVYVDVVAGIDVTKKEAFWIFESTDPATGLPPDAELGFLLVNDTITRRGEGFVSYTIKPDQKVATGDSIYAIADIVFDINESILTPEIFNTVDAIAPTSSIEPVPALVDSVQMITVSGQDDFGLRSSGIDNYDLYVSEDNGATFSIIARDIPMDSSYRFTGTPGREYCMYAASRDRVGNTEQKNVADVCFSVTEQLFVDLISPNGGEMYCAGTSLTLEWEEANVNSIDIQLSPDGGDNYYTIASAVPTDESRYILTIPDSIPAGNDYLFRIRDNNDPTISDASESAFFINNLPSPQIIADGGMQICVNDSSTLDAGSGYASYNWSTGANTRSITVDSAGVYSVEVTGVNGCVKTGDIELTEKPAPDVTFAALDSVCQDAAPFALTGGAPEGGVYTGRGVDASGNFDPYTAGYGNHEISYTYEGENGCVNTARQTIIVNPRPLISMVPLNPVTVDSEAFALDIASPRGGTYSGPGIDSLGNFDPQAAGIGTHTITYSYEAENGCSNSLSTSIVVSNDATLVAISLPNGGEQYCVGKKMIITWGAVNVDSVDIAFSQDGGNSFEPIAESVAASKNVHYWSPESLAPGSQYLIKISDYANDSIFDISDDFFTVNDIPQPSITATNNGVICVGDTALLDAGAGYATYDWSTGETSRTIKVLAADTYTVEVTNGGGCVGTDTISIITTPAPDVTLAALDSICEDADAFALTGGLPAGGMYSGTGVDDAGNFDPALAGEGVHVITYTYQNEGGCSAEASQPLIVLPLPGVSFAALEPVTVEDSAFVLTGGAPAGGTYSGPGVDSLGVFNPAVAGAGTHVITYEYTSDNGCSNEATQVITVTGGTGGDYDDKGFALLLDDLSNWCSEEGTYTTIGATPDEGKGTCWADGPNNNRWFKFQATTNTIAIDLKTGGAEGTMSFPYITMWDGAGNELACASYTDTHSDLSIQSANLVPGAWYFVAVDNRYSTDDLYSGSFTLCVNNAVDNDFKQAAYELTDISDWCSVDGDAFNTTYATADESAGSCWREGPNYNRWYKFRATTNNIAIDLNLGTLRYPYIALWDDANNELACAEYTAIDSDLRIQSAGLTPGEWYYVAVDNRSSEGGQYQGSFTLCVDDSAIDNDFKQAAYELTGVDSWCSGEGTAFSTAFATADESVGSCWNEGPNYNRWFKFQATTTDIAVSLKVGGEDGTMRYPYIALWDDSNNELACAGYTSTYSDLKVQSTALTPGNWYFIAVDNRYSGTGDYWGSFTLCTSSEVDNDFRQAAITLSDVSDWCSGEAAYSTQFATADESVGSCWGEGPNYNRWFKFQATTDNIAVDLKVGGSEGTMRYPYIALWDDADNELACAQYLSDTSDLRIQSAGLTPGAWYYISVDNRYSDNGHDRGSFTLCLNDDALDYDFKQAAITLTNTSGCSSEAAYSTEFATADESAGSCWYDGPNYNRWFKFQAVTGSIAIDLKVGDADGTMRFPYIALWDADDNELACAQYTSMTSDLTIQSTGLTPGAWYYISVDNRYSDGGHFRGSFTLCLDDDDALDNDFKQAAYVLNDVNGWCSGASDAFNTAFASADQTAGSCWRDGPNYNRWFKFQATANTVAVDLKVGDTYGTMRYPYVALWDSTGNELACASYIGVTSDMRIQSAALTPGDWYYISVDNRYSDAGHYRGSFTLCVDDDVDNDFKQAAITLADINDWCSAPDAYTTHWASGDESGASCWNEGPNYNRWFKFQATTDSIAINLIVGDSDGAIRYPYMALWNSEGNELACADYAGVSSDLSIQSAGLIPGEWYYISVDNRSSSSGRYRGHFALCLNDGDNVSPTKATVEARSIGESSTDDFNIHNLQIVPNPAEHFIYLKLETPAVLENLKISVSDTYGVVIYNKQLTTYDFSSDLMISLNNMKSGVYYVTIEANEGKVIRKIIKL